MLVKKPPQRGTYPRPLWRPAPSGAVPAPSSAAPASHAAPSAPTATRPSVSAQLDGQTAPEAAPSLLDEALAYAQRGWPVFPVEPGDKHPRTPHGFKDATTDEATIRDWWQRWPDANVGIATGSASRLLVLDVDPRHGGDETLSRLEAEHGSLPTTPTVKTGGGGRHVYFASPADGAPVRSRAGALGDGLDVRADGGYVVAPPSCHASGERYTWATPPSTPLAPAPPSLLDALRAPTVAAPPSAAGHAAPSDAKPIVEGQRNVTLTRLAGKLRRDGLDAAAIEAALLKHNAARCRPALPDDEVRRIAQSIGHKHAGPDSEPDGPIVVALDTVTPEAVTWLWPKRIPRGKLTLVVGDPGLGKSTMLLDIAARVSIGASLPGGGQAPLGPVVLLTAEDGLADTVRPRFDAAGGDASRVHVLTAVQHSGNERPFSLDADLPHLEAVVRELRPALVVVDPLSAYLGKVDSHVDARVRGVLAPLARLAETDDVAVVAVLHLNKGQGPALYRPAGSIAFAASARSVLAVVADPDREGERRLIAVKSNLSAPALDVAFRIEPTEAGVARVVWIGERPERLDVDTALGGQNVSEHSAVEEATAFLREALADGPRPTVDVEAEARGQGIKTATLKRAKKRLGVRAVKRAVVGGRRGQGEWWWALPDQGDQGDQEAQGARPAPLDPPGAKPPAGE